MRSVWLALLAALALWLPSAAQADERILYFLSDVSVQRDGSLSVSETIRIRSQGDTIKRGIQRDFPTRYKSSYGRTANVGFEVEEVRRDGQPEPWTSMPLGTGVRVRIGDADVMLPPGEHTYLIRYRTNRQIGYFQGFDELYWNATGTEWTFPIDVAEARISLPEEAPFGKRAVYTGPQGSTQAFAAVSAERPGNIAFRTTAPLGAHEGLTVAVAWPKGVVAVPEPRTKLGWWLQDNGPLGLALLGLFGTLYYYFHAWRRAGRGPPAGTLVPIFSPPDGMSAAGVRYVSEMGSLDNRAFAAAIIDMGVRGRLKLIEGEKGFFTRSKTTIRKVEGDGELPAPEADMVTRLFAGEDSVLMDNENHAIFSAARSALESGLKKQYETSLFIRNWMWSVRGALIMGLAVWLVAAALIFAGAGASSRMGGTIGALAAFAIAAILYRASSPANSVWTVLGKMAAILLGCVGVAGGVSTVGTALEDGRILPLLVPLLALPVAISAFWWMAAPTRKGRALLDRIAGFHHYLSIAEEDRLETMHPPEKTPELFERYLPYAIALEVENEWASRFTRILATAAAASNGQTLSWYDGQSDPWRDTDGFVARVGSSLSSTISSASAKPGSSSGSSGGGSSGGGGGGGGGSGW
ncbi:MAG: DUF2207 domain-containing protein [Sphingosinicella sp.]|nr:DUF2207 domain-containing protein [Sphingosinicella sp.]